VQSWRGPASLAEAASAGFSGILSNGWYLDHMLPAAQHYAVDPLGKEAAALPAEARARILGGEACMWNEYVTAEMLDGRIWPRAAAIAERLWSAASVADPDDMYRRLEAASQRLEGLGLTHRSGPRRMLARLAAGRPSDALERFADVLEPVKGYARSQAGSYTSRTPLNRLVDAVRPESDTGRRFARLVDRFLADPARREGREEISRLLSAWSGLRAQLDPVFAANPMLAEAEPIAADLSAAAALALRALDGTPKGAPEDATLLDRIAAPRAELVLTVAQPIRRLLGADVASRLAGARAVLDRPPGRIESQAPTPVPSGISR
jgi:hexosaminidase